MLKYNLLEEKDGRLEISTTFLNLHKSEIKPQVCGLWQR
jgi:hypothetical protein